MSLKTSIFVCKITAALHHHILSARIKRLAVETTFEMT